MFSHVTSTTKSELSVRQNLKWLFVLRNLMLFSEAFLIFLSVHGLHIGLPERPLWWIVASIAAVNIYTWLRLDEPTPVTTQEIFVQLTLDVFAITALLYATGGASNPIIWVYLLPLMITAIMLPPNYAWYMLILTTSMYTMLMVYNIPLPSIAPHLSHNSHIDFSQMSQLDALELQHTLNDKNYFNLHIFGMWFGFVFSAGLVAFFVVELAKTLKIRERSLAQARENALRNERVVALGTLAASAAHDMGTPLGTMAIIAHELTQDYAYCNHPELYEKMSIIEEQINRCKEALSVMSASAGEMRAESGNIMLLSDYLDDVIKQWRTHKVGTKLNFFIDPNVDFEAKIIAERTLTHSLINILNNAAEATNPDLGVEFHAIWDKQSATIKIRDFGAGFPEHLLEFAGQHPTTSSKQGLGVGLFLTYSTLQRLGGTIDFENRYEGGAQVTLTLPLLHDETENDSN
ncbi:MAG: ATP-binding protein [Methylococcales bacterium]|nr:ATP-binding protein [Methylococcales bacterium]